LAQVDDGGEPFVLAVMGVDDSINVLGVSLFEQVESGEQLLVLFVREFHVRIGEPTVEHGF
jgi:hypothetical protein